MPYRSHALRGNGTFGVRRRVAAFSQAQTCLRTPKLKHEIDKIFGHSNATYISYE